MAELIYEVDIVVMEHDGVHEYTNQVYDMGNGEYEVGQAWDDGYAPLLTRHCMVEAIMVAEESFTPVIN